MTTFRLMIGESDIPYLEQVLDLFDFKIESVQPFMHETKLVILTTAREVDSESLIMDAYTIGYFVNKFKTSQCTK